MHGRGLFGSSPDNEGQAETGRKLPWSKAQNFRFAFSQVAVGNAGPGTARHIYVNGKREYEQKKPGAKGVVSRSVDLQD